MSEIVEQFGALGGWQKIDEKFDSTIIKQTNDASCVAAVGAMLADFYGLNLNQAEILENIGIWSNSELSAEFLNSKEIEFGVEWIGGGWDHPIEVLEWIIQNYKVLGALLREGSPVGHAVLICGEDESGLIILKDPFDQTSYNMTVENLQKVLSEFVWRKSII